MYTVLRFLARTDPQRLVAIGAAMNTIQSGVYDGLRPAGDSFACEVCRAEAWQDHLSSMEQFICRFSSQIADAICIGAQLEFDVAVASDELTGPYTEIFLRPEDLLVLARNQIGLVVTVYAASEVE